MKLLRRLFTHRLGKITFTLAAVGALVAGTSVAASASPDQDDPNVSGCSNGAYAVNSAHIAKISSNQTGGNLHLIFGPNSNCITNWAEFDNYPKGYSFVLVAWSDQGYKGYDQIQDERWTSNGDEVAWTDMVGGSGPANVAVCEYANGYGTLLHEAYLMQDSGDNFVCESGGGYLIDF